jgi:hypothetical protein
MWRPVLLGCSALIVLVALGVVALRWLPGGDVRPALEAPSQTGSRTANAAEPAPPPPIADPPAEVQNVRQALLDAHWDQAATDAVAGLNAGWFAILAEEDPAELRR